MENFSKIAEIIADFRTTTTPLFLKKNNRPIDISEGYVLQKIANTHLMNSGLGQIKAHKIGCTSEVMQNFLKINSPCAGDIFEKKKGIYYFLNRFDKLTKYISNKAPINAFLSLLSVILV